MTARTRSALVAALLLAPWIALAGGWDAADVAEAEKLRAAEAERAASYRERVARGRVRATRPHVPRDAPKRPAESAGDPLRDAADLVDFIERLIGNLEEDAEARDPEREELRRRERERRQ